ncbi:MAG: hypothetical protein QXL51_01515 [Candidatus Aenigmatarchaeota archaeon]
MNEKEILEEIKKRVEKSFEKNKNKYCFEILFNETIIYESNELENIFDYLLNFIKILVAVYEYNQKEITIRIKRGGKK